MVAFLTILLVIVIFAIICLVTGFNIGQMNAVNEIERKERDGE